MSGAILRVPDHAPQRMPSADLRFAGQLNVKPNVTRQCTIFLRRHDALPFFHSKHLQFAQLFSILNAYSLFFGVPACACA
jgi:hypothetical protein